MRYVIGIDIGTTSTKAVAFTVGGEVLGSAGSSYPVFADAGGRHELDPDQLLEAVLLVLRQVIAGQAAGDEAAGVSFSCAMHSLILVDDHGVALTRALTWADLRSEAYAAVLKGSEAGRRIYRQTGTPIHAMSPLCKLLWFKEQEPGLFRQAAHFISIKEYIWWKLFGKYQIDYSIASATGLFDIRRLAWYPESLELAGIPASRLSEPVSSMHKESALLPVWSSLGLPAELPFMIGGSDGCLANLGTGAVRPGAMALTIGTSGAVRMAVSKPEYDSQERIFSYILTEDLYICGGATNNGGNVIQWYANLILGGKEKEADPVSGRKEKDGDAIFGSKEKAAAIDRLVNSADSVPAGSEGLVFLPYLLGERAPIWDAEAKGVFFGIRSIHDQRYFMRAVLEGVSNCLRQVGASLEETTGPIERIYASGGFTRNKSWLQLIADVFLKQVCVTAQADASAIGAAMLGWYALGEFAGLHEVAAMVKVVATYEPDAVRHAVYRENYRVFTELYSRLKDLM